MIHPLVRKELREHLVVLVVMWLLCGLGFAGLLAAAHDRGSPLVAYWQLVIVFGTLLSLALANRLVVREYGGRTQLFLETLPVSRAQVIAIKWLTGAVCLLLPMASGLALAVLVASGEVGLTSRFVQLLALRGGLFLLFFYSLAFLIGLMGRYRYVLWLALLLAVFLADAFGQVPMRHWPPLQLVSQSMPFERNGIPFSWVWITGVITLVLVGATFALALGSRGSWVVALSRRMSLREKAIVAAAFLALLYLSVQVESRRPKPQFALQNAVHSPDGMPGVSVARTQGLEDERASGLARQIAEDLRTVREYLGMSLLPVVAVLPDMGIDADLYMLAELPDSDGVVVRGALGTEGFDDAGFRAFTIARVIDWHGRGRPQREQRRWLLDGFAQWHVAQADPVLRERLTLRAAAAARVIDMDDKSLSEALRNWHATREQLGECLGDALAWRAVTLLAQALGEDRHRQFEGALLGARPARDVRGMLAEVTADEQLTRLGGPAMDALMASLAEALRDDRDRLAGQLASVVSWPVRFAAMPMRGSSFEVHYDVALQEGRANQPFAVRYARLGPWATEISRAGLARVDATGPGVLPTTFTSGERVFTAVETASPELACTIRLGAQRWVVQ